VLLLATGNTQRERQPWRSRPRLCAGCAV